MIHLFPDWVMVALEITSLVGGLLGALAGAVIWVTRNTFVTKTALQDRFEEHDERHVALDTRLAKGDSRFAVIETELQHLPKAADIQALTSRIGAVEGGVGAIAVDVKGVRELLRNIERPLNTLVDRELMKRTD